MGLDVTRAGVASPTRRRVGALVALLAVSLLVGGCTPAARSNFWTAKPTWWRPKPMWLPPSSTSVPLGRPSHAATRVLTTKPTTVVPTTQPRATTMTTEPPSSALPTTRPPVPTTRPTTTVPTEPSTGAVRTGIEVTVYYTAVESFHSGPTDEVRGCMVRECEFGDADLGTYPRSFVEAVRAEGTGRITSGVHVGRYLNWSFDVGYWLDSIASDSYGNALVPLVTAACDTSVARRGQKFRLIAPLLQDNGDPLDARFASQLLAGEWLVNDEFTPGLGGPAHVDVYIGEEDQVDFTETSPKYVDLRNVTLQFTS